MPRKPNILFLVSDSTRAGWLGCYGGTSGATPNLDRWSSGACLYERAYAASTWTAPAVASLLTGVLPGSLQIRLSPSPAPGVLHNETLPDGLATLAEILGAAGYSSVAVTANPLLQDHYRLTRGFGIRSHHFMAPADELIRIWQDARSRVPEPWFAYLHFMDCHHPLHIRPLARESGIDFNKYKLSPMDSIVQLKYFRKRISTLTAEEQNALELLYLGELAHLDSCLAPLLDAHREDLVIFTADHGEMLAERVHHPALASPRIIGVGHAKPPYEGLARIPLLVRPPGGSPGRRLGDLVSQADFTPTLVDYLGLAEPPGQFQGRTFAATLTGGRGARNHVVCERLEDNHLPCHEIAVVTERWKYIQFAAPQDHTGMSLTEPPWHIADRSFAGRFQLAGWTGVLDEAAPGDALALTLYWRALVPLTARLLGMVHFVRQKDRSTPYLFKFFPVHGLHRPDRWNPGQVVADPLRIPIPANLPGGEYAVRVGLLDLDAPESSEPDSRFIGGLHTLGTLRIVPAGKPPALSELPISPVPMWIRDRLGWPTHFRLDTPRVQAGGSLEFHLRWAFRGRRNIFRWLGLALVPEEAGPPVRRRLIQSRYGVVDTLPSADAHTVDEQVALPLPGDLPPGRYRLHAGVLPRRRLASIPWLMPTTGALVTIFSAEPRRLAAPWLELAGCDCRLQRLVPGRPATVRFFWRRFPSATEVQSRVCRLRIVPDSGGPAVEHSFRPPGPAARADWPDVDVQVAEETVQIPTDFPTGPCELRLDGGAGTTERPVYRMVAGRPEDTRPAILREELYDLGADPDEANDLAGKEPDMLRRLRGLADAHRADCLRRSECLFGGSGAAPSAEPAEIRRQLEALGYLEGDS